MDSVISCCVAAVIGAVVGVLSGLLGVGGGTMTLPIFRLGFGMTAIGSTATSLFTIIPTSISGAITHIRGKTCVPKLGIALGVGGALTSPVGVMLAQASPGWMVMVAAALAIGYSSITMLRKAIHAPKEGSTGSEKAGTGMADSVERAGVCAADESAGTASESASPANERANAVGESAGNAGASTAVLHPDFGSFDLLKSVAIGIVAGVVSGYIGLGGGFLMIPMMLSLLRMPMKLASGTSLIAIMILATPATITQCALGNVNYMIGIALVCGSIPGAMVGARLISRVPERALRFGFAIFLGIAAVLLVVRELVLFG